MKNTALTAIGGTVSALSVFLLFLTGMIPNTTYLFPAFSALLLVVTLEEADLKWSVFIYVAVSALTFLIVTDKEAAIMYTFVFGYYPILKKFFEGHLSKPLSWLLKILTYNVMMVIAYLLIIYVFLIPVDGMDTFGKWTPLILLGMMNLVLLVFDYLITVVTRLYNRTYSKRIRKLFQNK